MNEKKYNFINLRQNAKQHAEKLDLILGNYAAFTKNTDKKTRPSHPALKVKYVNEIEEIEQNNSKVLRILLLEDSETDADLLIRHLRREKIDFNYTRVLDKASFTEQLKLFTPDLVIADFTLPQFNGIEAFRLMKKEGFNLPFILVTGSISEKLINQLVKEGIDDYLLKDNLLRLPNAIMNIVHKKQLEREKKITEALNGLLVLSNKKLEEAYMDMKSSINYAKRIQQDMLPEMDFLNRAAIDHMLIYKPKDVLSGDFYWASQRGDKIFIAVADCTGHGVPGALLSMAGHNIINEIVNEDSENDPGNILTNLNERFRKMLKQDTTSTHDGMEIGFCAIHTQTKVLEYAGAKIPLYHVSNGVMKKITPDKISIGGVENRSVQFQTQTVELKNGDRIFMFSDGIIDQFDSSDNEKVTRKRFEKLIKTFYLKSISDIKQETLNFLSTWQGGTPQTDDILILGVEFK